MLHQYKLENKLFYHYVKYTIQINGSCDLFIKWIQLLKKLLIISTRI